MAGVLGATIGGCRIEALIGSTTTGAVYRGCHIPTGQPLALRLLGADLRHSPELRAAFHQEAQLAAMLSHPQIVRVYASGEWQNQGFLLMEYVAGGSLAGLLTRIAGRPLALPLALDLARQCAEGLAYAQRFGVTHGDLRPRNLMLARDPAHPERLRLKIGDFGLARLGMEMLAVGGLAAPPLYLAPEQCLGCLPDARSDVYGLGLVLYEMLAGRPAFPAATYAEAVRRQQSQPAPALGQARTKLPPSIESLVAGCLARNPLERPACAAELIPQLSAEIARLAQPDTAAA